MNFPVGACSTPHSTSGSTSSPCLQDANNIHLPFSSPAKQNALDTAQCSSKENAPRYELPIFRRISSSVLNMLSI